MNRIDFSDVGVVVKSMEEVDEVYLTLTALGIPFADTYKEDYTDAQNNLDGWYIQTTSGVITTNTDEDEFCLSLINYPIIYSMDILDFAVACHLLISNETDELIAHLDKHCKEYK